MSNAIVSALVQAAEQVGRAIEDAAKSVGHFFEDTGRRLEQSAKSHLEHDGKAAADLERAAKHGDETPTIHGRGGASTTPSAAGPGSGAPGAGVEVDRITTFGQDVQTGFHEKSTNPATSGQFPPGYRPMSGMSVDEYLAKYSHGWDERGHPAWNWSEEAPNNGALGPEEPTHVAPGAYIDRYGGSYGKYLSPDGTVYPQRGLPADNLTKPYYRYEVLKPLPAQKGIVAPAFGEDGLGVQYRLAESVQFYLDHGYLREVAQ